ncbi:hypothetical protein CARUB_v10003420mg [Capsella rubella]|uniref:Ubiquitin-like domain-containing protein n=1 Tax=Capsella rubella TaxID=81985 RepID=R0HFY9_9BRAS|nr:hypothetical protein CARUB_v10003420mg [Capsella rubella]
MKFVVKVLNGSCPPFEVKMDNKDTMLQVKNRIQKSQYIPVARQIIVVDGVVILRNDLTVKQCGIVGNSRIQLDIS